MVYTNIMSGFKATGLYPLNADAIPETAFAPSILTERRISGSNSNNCGPSSRLINANVRRPHENFTGSGRNIETDIDSRQSSPTGNIQHLQNLIDTENFLPLSPTTPDLGMLSSTSPIEYNTPSRINMNDTNCLENRPGPSDLQITHRLVEYSDSTSKEQDSIASEADNIYTFINRFIPPKRLRICSSSDTECDIENVNPYNATLPESDGGDTEDDEPLVKISRSKKTDFQKFMPTPDYSVINKRPRRKALNYKGQRVTKDLFNTEKKPKKNHSNNITKTTKKTHKQIKKRSIKPKSTEEREWWYCLACKEERIAADIRQCMDYHQWYHAIASV